MNPEISQEIRTKIEQDPDFVNLPRFGNSVARVRERYPDGAPPKLIAQALAIPEETVGPEYTRVVGKLRTLLGI